MGAKQGAAALRYDCWYYRKWLENNPDAPRYNLIGLDPPYPRSEEDDENNIDINHDDDSRQHHHRHFIECIPVEIMQQIERQIQKWKERAFIRQLEQDALKMEVEHDNQVLAEEVAYRDAYMESRGGRPSFGQYDEDEKECGIDVEVENEEEEEEYPNILDQHLMNHPIEEEEGDNDDDRY